MCGPDTQNWGQVLKQNDDHNILVAGYDWLPAHARPHRGGLGRLGAGQQPLRRRATTRRRCCSTTSPTARALPTGAQNGEAVWADKSNIAEVRNSPDVKMGK